MKKQTRSEARETAFSLIFQAEKGNKTEEVLNNYIADNKDGEVNLGYISEVVNGVNEKKIELEDTIKGKLKKNWTIGRISKTSLIVLKLAIYEMKYVDDVPPKVAINEAVELAKKYGTETDGSFVNGLLGNVMKEI